MFIKPTKYRFLNIRIIRFILPLKFPLQHVDRARRSLLKKRYYSHRKDTERKRRSKEASLRPLVSSLRLSRFIAFNVTLFAQKKYSLFSQLFPSPCNFISCYRSIKSHDSFTVNEDSVWHG